VNMLLAKNADINAKDGDDATALMVAASSGHTETVRLLLAHDADTNIATTDGQTALMAAAYGGYGDIVDLLLAKKADITAKDSSQRTALVYAAANGHTELVQLFLKSGQKEGADVALAVAANGCETPVVKALMAAGAQPTTKLRGAPVTLIAAAANCEET